MGRGSVLKSGGKGGMPDWTVVVASTERKTIAAGTRMFGWAAGLNMPLPADASEIFIHNDFWYGNLDSVEPAVSVNPVDPLRFGTVTYYLVRCLDGTWNSVWMHTDYRVVWDPGLVNTGISISGGILSVRGGATWDTYLTYQHEIKLRSSAVVQYR